MTWIAPSGKETANAALEKRLWAATGSAVPAPHFAETDFNGGRPQELLGLVFLRFPGLRGSAQGACTVGLSLALFLFLCGCSTNAPQVMYMMKQDLGVVTDVQPLVVQPDLAKWRALKLDMTEAEVTALLGNPYRKNPRPPLETNSAWINLYSWDYGEITFASFTTKGSFAYAVTFHDGRVYQIRDPWAGRFSPDGRPTVPELVMPNAGQTLGHYPRFIDFRWMPASGVYPIEYEITIEALGIEQSEAEDHEAYIQKTVDANRPQWRSSGMSKKEMDAMAISFARQLRQDRGVVNTFQYRTHDIYLPFTWVGANTGRWRIRATNEKGASDWTGWRYFKFSI